MTDTDALAALLHESLIGCERVAVNETEAGRTWGKAALVREECKADHNGDAAALLAAGVSLPAEPGAPTPKEDDRE